jgi:non-specific serine/threonine protein kinase/serine/threonine-protein kinase
MLSVPVAKFDACAENISAAREGSGVLMVGQRLGAYELIREIGRGGMGTVYLARRADEEFEKEVAIKLLKRGTDTDEVLRRFRAERQILARLEHPNIARLLDAGTSDDGLPYFVMEYVVGETITDFCSANNLGIRGRLQLFLKVCAPIQFAHQNLVVHRDLKPANILISAEGEPKLLDFGIAKLLDPTDAPATVTALDGQRLTPAYASPEQVRGEPITTVSDVYSLGALLYELLAGTPPHRFATPHPSPTELLRVVAEQEPLRPSAAIAKGENSKFGPSRTGHRDSKFLKGDLDNILLQALRKEPGRRYPGVNAFAEDIRRYLGNFPVRARSDTLRYRTSKFVRRNRVGVAAAMLVLLALLGGLSVAAWQARRARVGEARALERFNQVRQLARSVLFDYHDAIAALPGSTAVRQRLVQDALQYLDNLSKEAAGDRALLRELADAYEKVAAVQSGSALSIRGTVLAASNLGDTQGGLASQGKVLSIREQLADFDRSNAGDLQGLANAHSGMANLYMLNGKPEKALEHFRQAILLVERLLEKTPANEDIRFLAATNYIALAKALGSPVHANVGDTRGALEYARKALNAYEQLAAEHPTNLAYQQALANTHNTRGHLFNAMGQRKEQLAEMLKAADIDRALVAAEPGNTLYLRELAVQLGNVGSVMVQLKDKPGAMPYFREALAIYEGLVAADPNDASTRRQWAVANRNVGAALGATNREEAFPSLQKAIDILADLVSKNPKNGDFRRQWAFSYLALSRVQVELDDPAGAVASALEGIRIDEALVADAPADVSAQNTLALLYTQLGASHVQRATKADAPKEDQREHWRNAKGAYTKTLEIYQTMKAKGTLAGADAKKPDEIAAEIARCDEAL